MLDGPFRREHKVFLAPSSDWRRPNIFPSVAIYFFDIPGAKDVCQVLYTALGLISRSFNDWPAPNRFLE